MISLDNLSNKILNKWNNETDTILLLITNDMKIVKYNKNFEPYSKLFTNLSRLITYTHKSSFNLYINECIKGQGIVSFNSNFSFYPKDVEDIPFSYKVILEYIKDNEIIVLLESIAPLTHEDAKAYFAMVNEYSSISRKIQKSDFYLNKKNIELNDKIEKLEYYANYDHLTKLYNRRRILEELEHECNKYKRLNNDFCIIMIDVDYFKKINDTYGHQNGDIALSTLSEELKLLFREYDSIGRFGGEEFLIILPSTIYSIALVLIERVLNSISKMSIELSDNQILKMTLSAGVAQIEKNMVIDDLILLADNNLYKAKKNGRNQAV